MPRCWITKPEQLNLQLPMLFIEHCPAQVGGCSISGVLVPTEGRDVALLVDLISRPFVPTYLHPSHPNPHRLIWNKSVLLWWMQCSAPYWANRARVEGCSKQLWEATRVIWSQNVFFAQPKTSALSNLQCSIDSTDFHSGFFILITPCHLTVWAVSPTSPK